MIAAIAGAVRLETVAPDRARRLWAAADRRLVDEAAWVPLVNEVTVHVTGPRRRQLRLESSGRSAAGPDVGPLTSHL